MRERQFRASASNILPPAIHAFRPAPPPVPGKAPLGPASFDAIRRASGSMSTKLKASSANSPASCDALAPRRIRLQEADDDGLFVVFIGDCDAPRLRRILLRRSREPAGVCARASAFLSPPPAAGLSSPLDCGSVIARSSRLRLRSARQFRPPGLPERIRPRIRNCAASKTFLLQLRNRFCTRPDPPLADATGNCRQMPAEKHVKTTKKSTKIMD